MKETIIIKNNEVISRCYSKQELIIAIKEASGITLKKESVAKLQESGLLRYDEYGCVYIPVKDRKELNNYGYHRKMIDAHAEESVWDEMMHSAWFYAETGIELFEKTSFS